MASWPAAQGFQSFGDDDEPEATRGFPIERVFPIRVRVRRPTLLSQADSRASQVAQEHGRPRQRPAADEEPGLESHEKTLSSDPPPQVIAPPPAALQRNLDVTGADSPIVSERFILSENGGFVSNSKPGQARMVYRCEDEPIHIPGAIQQFGALVAVREEKDGSFLVRIASENSQKVIGLAPKDLFELSCLTDLLPRREKEDFIARIHSLRSRPEEAKPKTKLDICSMSLGSSVGSSNLTWCALHLIRDVDLIVCEFELQSDVFNLNTPPNTGLPDEPVSILDDHSTEEAQLLSTTKRSTPLYPVQFARDRGDELGPMVMLHALCEIQSQLAAARSLPIILDVIVGLIAELTGFHRVMIYQFDQNACGSVVSELINKRASTDIFRGLHFPASDIPKQARELYMINTIRILYDREQETARLVCRTLEDAAKPLDLTHSYLRAMSPVHLKYLKNLGVQASMSLSLPVNNELWGLATCHSYGSGMRVSLPLRELCRSLGDLAGAHIEKLIYASRVQARRPISTLPPQKAPSAYISASSSDLLNLFDADFGLLTIKDEARSVGRLMAYNEAIALLQYARMRSFTTIVTSSNIKRDFPDLSYSPGFSTIAGFLVIPLAMASSDFLVLFRRGQLKEVQWAGNPYEKIVRKGSEYLEPRASFQRWSEHVRGTSREWTQDQVDSAAVLSVLYGRFIEIWRQKEAVVRRARMTRLLIQNASHEVRTPLNSIINYLEMALEQPLDERARENLEKSLAASKSLVFVISDLLNLTDVDTLEFPRHEETFNLNTLLASIVEAFTDEAVRKNLAFKFDIDRLGPQFVRGDLPRLRQALSNLLANAVENSVKGTITLGLRCISMTGQRTLIEISIEDMGSGMSEEELDALFQDFEQVLDEDRNEITGPESRTAPSISEPKSIGLGLAIVARFVRLNHGQIKISSVKGTGTRVSMRIPFREVLQASPEIPEYIGRAPFSTTRTDTLNSSSTKNPPPKLALQAEQDNRPAGHLVEHSSPGNLFQTKTSITPSDVPGQQTEPILSPASEIFSSGDEALSPGDELYPESPSDSILKRDCYPFPNMGSTTVSQAHPKLSVLVTEDNPLNSRLLETRLMRDGYDTAVAINGQACVDVVKARPQAFDVILMDIQMPIVDGVTATRLIRDFEKEYQPALSEYAQAHGRIPIFAVSASLREDLRDNYAESGFDAWIHKPINFKSLRTLLQAVRENKVGAEVFNERSSLEDWGWLGTNMGKVE